jgi:hypothetical protein
MRHSPWRPGGAALAALAIALAGLGGCSMLPVRSAAPPPPPVRSTTDDSDAAAAILMANTFQDMRRLVQAAPAEQAEILAAARANFQRTPRGSAQLRYALLLATPGHPARNPTMAQVLLRELAAQPETLVPIERAVVLVELAQLDRELGLQQDNEQLRADALREDQQHSAAAQRRLQAEVDENTRLRKQLEEAQAKLDAVATIERNLTDRKSGTEVRPP